MFGRRFELFKAFGIPIRVDLSWFVIAVLITWTLATATFPGLVQGLPPPTYWWMGVAGALALFTSVVLHELGHALTAQKLGMKMRGITLFIFGGVAEMSDEPPNARTEFLVAVAGPAVSLAIAGLCGLASTLGRGAWPPAAGAVLFYLATVNAMLVLFNLIPAFPLDGGRVLRSALWHWRGSLRWATRVTSGIGSGFGLLFIGLGLYSVLRGNLVGGIWWFLIGMFLRNAAQMSYQQLLLRRALEGEPVARFMREDPVSVPRHVSVEQLVDDYIYKHHFKMYPVVDGDRLVGCVTTRQVRELPREEWARTSVGALAAQCGPANTVSPQTDAMQALSAMSRTGASRLMVVDGDRLLGVLALKDLLRFFALKMELEESR